MESLPHLLWPEGLLPDYLYLVFRTKWFGEGVVKGVAKNVKKEMDSGTQVVNMPVSAGTRYIISTSGRPSSMRRYKVLLRDILKVNISYILTLVAKSRLARK